MIALAERLPDLDQVFDRGPAVCPVGARKRAGRLECRLAGCGPKREVCHSRELLKADVR
jgi:hypothetical protein